MLKLLKKTAKLEQDNRPHKEYTAWHYFAAVALFSILIPIVAIMAWSVFQMMAPHLANTTYALSKSPDLVLVFLVALGVTIIVKNI